MALARRSGAEAIDRSGAKCNSASQTASKPKRSAASAWAKDYANASASDGAG
jgi:hypothetical protein